MTATVKKKKPSTQSGILFQSRLLEQSERRFKDYEASEILAIATILDPRFKKMHFQKPMLCANAVAKIDAMIKSKLKEARAIAVENAENN